MSDEARPPASDAPVPDPPAGADGGRTDDAQSLAGFIDGRLDVAERAAMIRRLARSDDALDALADAASVVEELERGQGDGAPGAPSTDADDASA